VQYPALACGVIDGTETRTSWPHWVQNVVAAGICAWQAGQALNAGTGAGVGVTIFGCDCDFNDAPQCIQNAAFAFTTP
jgi:hypothetical protein